MPAGCVYPNTVPRSWFVPLLVTTLTTPPVAWPYSSFVARRLDLDFLDEVERHAGSERAEHDGVGAEGAISRIGDIDAVDDVLIFKAAGAATEGLARPVPPPLLTPGARYSVSLRRRWTGTRASISLSMFAPTVVLVTSTTADPPVTSTVSETPPTSSFRLSSARCPEPHFNSALFHRRLEPREFRAHDVDPRRQGCLVAGTKSAGRYGSRVTGERLHVLRCGSDGTQHGS